MSKHVWPTPMLDSADSFTGGTKDRWHLNACIGPQLSDERAWNAYTEGFRTAGRKLVDTFIEQGNTFNYLLDTVVYPIVFLYRHHFELLLKNLVEECNIVEHGKWGIPKGHQLLQLWQQCRPRIEQILPEATWTQNSDVDRLFEELDKLDPVGQAARYPSDTKGKKTFAGLPLLNLEHFADTADRLSNYLEQVLTGLASRRPEYE